jgi:oligosaccharyl transferase (archaeosortase A-associated)
MRIISANTKSIEKASLIYGAILALIFALSLYIRVVVPYDSLFSATFVRFGGNDPWYNMRLVESTLHNFPHRIYFDAFTYYPHGTTVPFAPLFDYLLAVIIWMIGLGDPYATLGQYGIDTIGAWYPAVLGALTVIPVYCIGKELWTRNAGLISAALIAVLPGQFLSRSMLGFTDHHVAETLFSTIAMLFLILAIMAAKKNEITFYSILEKDWSSLKKPLIYSILGGIFLGSFYLSWKGAPLFIFVLLVYAVVQYIIDHVREKSTDYLFMVFIPTFLISLIIIAPVPIIGTVTGIQSISLILGIVVFGLLSAISFLLTQKKINPYWYPIVTVALGVTSLALLSVLSPSLYSALTGQLRIFFPSVTQLTVQEIHPMHIFSPYTGKITDAEAWQWFTTTFFIALVAFPWIGYRIARKFRPDEILVIVWSAVMLFACFGQNRFAAYYAVNVALLCGFVYWKAIEFLWFRGVVGEDAVEKARKIKGKKKGGALGGDAKKARTKKATKDEKIQEAEKIKRYTGADLPIMILIIGIIGFVGFVLFYPPLTVSLASAEYVGGPVFPELFARFGVDDWYESLSWLKENTPDPGVDYYALYDAPPINKTINRIEDYKYPESAYSIISWWDYGHWITRIGHRIPVANPFQQGIGGPYRNDTPGACVFFITRNESEANEVADALGVRYVVSDFMMADAFNAFYNKFGAMTTWAGDTGGYYTQIEIDQFVPSEKYFSTIVARLHIFDGKGVAFSEELYLAPLRHFRLVHESPTSIISFGGQEIKYVKVFEYVKGAKITGAAPLGSIVEIATNVSTNQGRKYLYAERMISNGSYEFIVPYSTEGPIDGGTNFDVFASPYKVNAGRIENATIDWGKGVDVSVPEEAVTEGKRIRVDLDI